MNRFVKPLSKTAVAGLLVAAMAIPGLALTASSASAAGWSNAKADTAAPAKVTKTSATTGTYSMPAKTPATMTAKPMVTKTSATMTAKPLAGKQVAELDTDHWSARVKAVQQALDNHGAALEVDGIWGPKTRAAILKYQKAHGLKATGHANKATWQSLKLS